MQFISEFISEIMFVLQVKTLPLLSKHCQYLSLASQQALRDSFSGKYVSLSLILKFSVRPLAIIQIL